MRTAFEVDHFVADCRAAMAAQSAQELIREIVARAIANPQAVIAALGAPARAELRTLLRSPALTILNVTLAPTMVIPPHDHRMWAVIGVYTGREDNIFWRRAGQSIMATGAKALSERDAEMLPADVIHSVINPVARLTGAIHVYGGDFFGVARSQWDPETLREQPFDGELARQRFDAANLR